MSLQASIKHENQFSNLKTDTQFRKLEESLKNPSFVQEGEPPTMKVATLKPTNDMEISYAKCNQWMQLTVRLTTPR